MIVMTAKVTFHVKYLGQQFLYKYRVISAGVNPEELLFIGQANAEECRSCFRVRKFPTSKH